MNRVVTLSARSADFQRALLALRYYWGARGDELDTGLDELGVTSAAADVRRGLADSERQRRASVLAVELGRLAAELDRRSVWR